MNFLLLLKTSNAAASDTAAEGSLDTKSGKAAHNVLALPSAD